MVGWNREPGQSEHPALDEPVQFRYWNGTEWTFQATARRGDQGRGSLMTNGHLTGRAKYFRSGFFRNPVVFHVMAWFDCSVPFTRGRLSRIGDPIGCNGLIKSGG